METSCDLTEKVAPTNPRWNSNAGKNDRVYCSSTDICSNGITDPRKGSWSAMSTQSYYQLSNRSECIVSPKVLCHEPHGICTNCSICILGRGEMELITRCDFQRGGVADWSEKSVPPLIPFPLLGKKLRTSSVNVEICSDSTLHFSLHQYQGTPEGILMSEELSSRCFSWTCVFTFPPWSNQMSPGLCESPEKCIGLVCWYNQWFLYNVSFKSSSGAFHFLYIWKYLWFLTCPLTWLSAASSLSCKLSEVPYWNKLCL